MKASIQKRRAALVGIEESVDTILLSIEGTPSGSELPNDRPLLQAAMLNDRQPPAINWIGKYTDLKICILRDIQIFMSN